MRRSAPLSTGTQPAHAATQDRILNTLKELGIKTFLGPNNNASGVTLSWINGEFKEPTQEELADYNEVSVGAGATSSVQCN